MHWRNILSRAFRDTWNLCRHSLVAIILALLSLLIGWPFAKWVGAGSTGNEALGDFWVHTAVPFVFFALCVFSLNLWLAPYRIVSERLSDLECSKTESSTSEAPPPERFRRLSSKVVRCLGHVQRVLEEHDASIDYWSVKSTRQRTQPTELVGAIRRDMDTRLTSLRTQLSELNIDSPKLPVSYQELPQWEAYLSRILELTTNGQLEEAKQEARMMVHPLKVEGSA